ncbi:MAG: hypothetical protein ACJ789_10175 [Thermomicrobiales bacterium]
MMMETAPPETVRVNDVDLAYVALWQVNAVVLVRWDMREVGIEKGNARGRPEATRQCDLTAPYCCC